MGPILYKNNEEPIKKLGSRMIKVASIGTFVGYYESENKKYLIACSDLDKSRGVGGFRESGEGSYILGENSKVLLIGKLQRPNDGKVSNNGNYIIHDWLFGDGLRGIFYAFDKSGRQLLNHQFQANLLSNGISNDGRYAVCQCAISDSDDSGVLAFFDLDAGAIMWKITPENGWANSYLFDSKKRIVCLKYRDGEKCYYNYEEEFICKEKA
jgi:hypothetical protein